MQVMAALIEAGRAALPALAAAQQHVELAPLGAPLPHLVLEQPSRVERHTVSRGEVVLVVTSRIRVTVVASSFVQKAAMLHALRQACDNKPGVIEGITVLSTRTDVQGPPVLDADAGITAQAQDFIVVCHEPGPGAP